MKKFSSVSIISAFILLFSSITGASANYPFPRIVTPSAVTFGQSVTVSGDELEFTTSVSVQGTKFMSSPSYDREVTVSSFTLNPNNTITFTIPNLSEFANPPSGVQWNLKFIRGVYAGQISVNLTSLAAPAFTLSSSVESKTQGQAISGYTINSTGGAIASYSISPSIGNGLSFDTVTGLITGTPLAVAPEATYTITGTNATSSTSVTYKITVTPAAQSSATQSAAAWAAAWAARDAAIAISKAQLLQDLNSNKTVDLKNYRNSDFPIYSQTTADRITADLLALQSKTSESILTIDTVSKVVDLHSVTEKLSNPDLKSNIYVKDLVRVGFLDIKGTRNATILARLRDIPKSDLDSPEKIASQIKIQVDFVLELRNRLLLVLGRN